MANGTFSVESKTTLRVIDRSITWLIQSMSSTQLIMHGIYWLQQIRTKPEG